VQIAELRFGDVGRGVGNYRPVLAAIAAIAVMGLVLPGPKFVAKRGFDVDAFDNAQSTGALAAPAAVGDVPQSAEVASAVSAIETAPRDFASPLASSTSSASSSSFAVDASATRTASEDSSADATTFDSSTPATSTPRAATAQPLRIVTAAWASAQAGTPLATTGVPEGALPVGRRPGFAQDKVAFVRLAGTATTLTLLPHEDAAGQRAVETAQIQACRITSPGWSEAQGQSIDEAPKWDCAVAVQGLRSEDGRWTFDLSVFADRAGANGFALIPVGDALDYQVAFTVA
jgi:hypothetical protein